jgi:hypothetical protein
MLQTVRVPDRVLPRLSGRASADLGVLGALGVTVYFGSTHVTDVRLA